MESQRINMQFDLRALSTKTNNDVGPEQRAEHCGRGRRDILDAFQFPHPNSVGADVETIQTHPTNTNTHTPLAVIATVLITVGCEIQTSQRYKTMQQCF